MTTLHLIDRHYSKSFMKHALDAYEGGTVPREKVLATVVDVIKQMAREDETFGRHLADEALRVFWFADELQNELKKLRH